MANKPTGETIMRVLRTAVIGLGRVGWQFHIPGILKHDGFELVAVVDPLPERRAEAQQAFGAQGRSRSRTSSGGIQAYPDHVALLDATELDLVVIASPTPFHAEQTIAAFEHGVDVFCDKPMAPTLRQTDAMIAAMKKHSRKLMVYQPHRARVEIVALQAILSQDLIGPLTMIKRSIARYARRNDWQAFARHGGGMLNNYGAHYIDQLLYLSRSTTRRVACSLRTVASLGDADDVVKALIETDSGVILDIDINMASAHPMPPWQVLGKRGSIVLDQEQNAWQVRFYRSEDLPELDVQEGLAARDRRYESGERIPWQETTVSIADFEPIDFYDRCYDYFGLGDAPFVPIAQTREVMRVLDECRKSAASGGSFWRTGENVV
jgi:scyllo-inositol 2-dehydrogenase (NADP+)